MAGKAWLIAASAITLTLFNSSWLKRSMNLATAATILEVISQRNNSRGHKILTQAQMEPYTPVL